MCASIVSNETREDLSSECVSVNDEEGNRIGEFSRAGYVNPLQHMRGPNENVIEIARTKVKESVQVLEMFLEWKSDIYTPVDACFGLIDIENGTVSCDWSQAQMYPLVECLARVTIPFKISSHLIFRLPMISVRFISTNKIISMHTPCFIVYTIFVIN